MPKLVILPSLETSEFEEGETIAEALHRAGINMETPCGSEGICGHCGVWVENPEDVPPTPHERITDAQSARGLRLACQAVPRADVRIRLPHVAVSEVPKILEGFSFSEAYDDEELDVERPDLVPIVEPAAHVIEHTDDVTYLRGPHAVPFDEWEQEYSPKGLAIDLGTTTLVVTLISLRSGEELATASAVNPQVQFGHDVVSRIGKGATAEGLRELSTTVREGLNELLFKVCEDSGSQPQEIAEVVIGANTAMLQMAAMIDPTPLGVAPFAAGIRGGTYHPVERFGLEANPNARVYIPPIVHTFVGSDISAGMLACKRTFDGEYVRLFIDVGTNGELVLTCNERWIATSAAAGPAFEGMGLSCGMRASEGALEVVHIDGNTLRLGTIGDTRVQGISGSGAISLVACLLELGVLDGTGLMRRPGDTAGIPPAVAGCLEELYGKPAFRVAEDVYLTQADVRQVQLAKGAIRAAIDLTLQEARISPTSVDEVILGGAFGYTLQGENLEVIGMIPPGMKHKLTFAGNTCWYGCVQLLLDASRRSYIEREMSKVEHLSLAEKPEFMEAFVWNMEFPDVHQETRSGAVNGGEGAGDPSVDEGSVLDRSSA
jgi:uncharacterized 2Fe-2S/4Fe-4S cluster protein (DUF4445 family)